jgi:serine/threonine protein kinase
MISRRLSHFKITAKLGEGGMGEVYRALDERLNREVALKLLPSQLAAEPERMERFRREAQMIASLSHPGIGAIYGLEEDQGTTFLVLELVEGEDLSERLARGPLPIEEAIHVAVQMATALEVAHERGIVHRDLKPSNVKLGADGNPRILDFGLAKIYTEEPAADLENTQSPTVLQATAAGMILGTPAYMAPEQAQGALVDKRADIWAFGVVLFEMLTGRRFSSAVFAAIPRSACATSAKRESGCKRVGSPTMRHRTASALGLDASVLLSPPASASFWLWLERSSLDVPLHRSVRVANQETPSSSISSSRASPSKVWARHSMDPRSHRTVNSSSTRRWTDSGFDD